MGLRKFVGLASDGVVVLEGELVGRPRPWRSPQVLENFREGENELLDRQCEPKRKHRR
jgi:hypothetical protein